MDDTKLAEASYEFDDFLIQFLAKYELPAILVTSIGLARLVHLNKQFGDKKDFIGCYMQEEKEMLKIVIMKIIENKPILSKEIIYIAVLYYYYSSIVLEYYATNFCPLIFFKNVSLFKKK